MGDDLVIFVVHQAVKHSMLSDDEISSVDMIDELLEKELTYWQANKSKEFMFYLEEDFDAQRDLQELEKLIEGSADKEDTRSSKEEKRRGDANKTGISKKQKTTMVWNDTNNKDTKVLFISKNA